jgi:hypothetical protein
VDRAAYHYRIERSIRYKDSLSMVVDGPADMSRYSIPYLCVNDKQSSEGRHGSSVFTCQWAIHVIGGVLSRIAQLLRLKNPYKAIRCNTTWRV